MKKETEHQKPMIRKEPNLEEDELDKDQRKFIRKFGKPIDREKSK